jgi:large subunit ribosomal protein L18Ae
MRVGRARQRWGSEGSAVALLPPLVLLSRSPRSVQGAPRLTRSTPVAPHPTQIYEKSPTTVKNFGIWFRYESRTGTHNAYKEFRELSLTDAINTMYQDMAGRSRAKAVAIQILKTAALKPSECKRPTVKQFHSSKIRFPLPHKIAKTPKEHKTTFKASRATTFC